MRALWVLLALVAGVGAGLGAFVALSPRAPLPAAPVAEPPALGAAVPSETASPEPPAPASASVEAEPAAVASSAAAASASAAAAAPTASAASAPEGASEPAAPEDVNACLRSLFSKDAFVSKAPSLRFVCEASQPKDIASRLRVAIVDSAGGQVSDSMKEWSQLGFYELAVVATLRGRCCGAVKPLELPATPEGCGDLGAALEAVALASRPGAEEAALDAAVERFDGDIRCAIKLKRAATYGYSKVLPGEASVYSKIRARMKR